MIGVVGDNATPLEGWQVEARPNVFADPEPPLTIGPNIELGSE